MAPAPNLLFFTKNFMENISKSWVPTLLKYLPILLLVILSLVILLVPACAPPPGAAHPKAPPGLPHPPGAFIDKTHPQKFGNLQV
jgi:hypothetical protein